MRLTWTMSPTVVNELSYNFNGNKIDIVTYPERTKGLPRSTFLNTMRLTI